MRDDSKKLIESYKICNQTLSFDNMIKDKKYFLQTLKNQIKSTVIKLESDPEKLSPPKFCESFLDVGITQDNFLNLMLIPWLESKNIN